MALGSFWFKKVFFIVVVGLLVFYFLYKNLSLLPKQRGKGLSLGKRVGVVKQIMVSRQVPKKKEAPPSTYSDGH
jgi:hypothetical protein